MISINNVKTVEELNSWRERMESYFYSVGYSNRALVEGMAIHRPIIPNPVVSIEEINFRFDSKRKELES